jgi:hypothetical protein
MSAKPPSELAIVGRALASIVWSAAARNIATITPGKTRRKACRVVSAGERASARSGVGTLAIAIALSICGRNERPQHHRVGRANGRPPRQG